MPPDPSPRPGAGRRADVLVCPYDFATPTYAEAVALRHAVLRVPLGRDIADDPLHEEYDQVHLGAFAGGILVGTASLAHTGAGLKMRQVAVAERQRGRGIGGRLVRAAEDIARRTGAERLYCHARRVAVPFYEAQGWRAEGEPFEEVGIPHRVMVSARARG